MAVRFVQVLNGGETASEEVSSASKVITVLNNSTAINQQSDATRVVRVLNREATLSEEVSSASKVITVVNNRTAINQTNNGFATEVVRPGGTVANISYGETLPPNPSEGQIFILTN